MDDEGREVEEADSHCGPMHVEKVLRQRKLMHKELELKEIFAGLPERLLHLGGLRGYHSKRHLPDK